MAGRVHTRSVCRSDMVAVCRYAREGGAAVLTSSFDENPTCCAGPAGIFFSALQKTTSSLFLLDPATRKVDPIALPGTPCQRILVLR